ncbi:MAG: helix-turn-helix domain-containing protein [Chitinophagaceae bacterium]
MGNIIDKVKIGENIRKIRHYQRISQTIFAEKLGVKYQTISQIEKGQIAPSIEILLKISSNFRISIESLLLQDEISTTPTPSLLDTPAIISPCPELLEKIHY